MKLVVIFGPAAVGKMTVGQELAKLTRYVLFHNHVTIEMLLPYFEFGSTAFERLKNLFRTELFGEIAKSSHPGLIFTYVWALDRKEDRQHIDGLVSQFTNKADDVCFVELAASQETRLARNRTENRLSHKPSKRRVEWSDSNLVECDDKYVLNSSTQRPFMYPDRHLLIDNSHASPHEVASQIVRHFDLQEIQATADESLGLSSWDR